jgi:adrenodoxin-NADP+ reductase
LYNNASAGHVKSAISRAYFHSVPITHQEKKLSVAIVGSGPSGCYTAKYLLSSIERDDVLNLKQVEIDVLDKLPTPFGLVRSGVAPDHPEVKNVENDFSHLFEKYTNGNKLSMAFFGNVTVGKDVQLDELQSLYDIVVLAYGCESDKKLGIPGENLKGVFSAREFVAWYNAHPDFTYLQESLKDVLNNPDDAQVVVIGQGNVALDCARILAKGRKELEHTDIASHALDIIQNGVKSTIVLGRRGHIQGAFTIKELRELTKLECADFIVHQQDLDNGKTEESIQELNSEGARPKVRIDKLLEDAASKCLQQTEHQRKKVELRFLMNPIKFIPDANDSSRLGSVLCEVTRLRGEAHKQVAIGTGEMREIPAQMALVSIGYKGVALPGMHCNIFNDNKGIVNNIHGKVESNLYVSGWLKRGPSGIIGTNIHDAKDTVASILNDIKSDELKIRVKDDTEGRNGLDNLLRSRKIFAINWDQFKIIDKAEKDATRMRNSKQPREKMSTIREMLKCLKF